MNFVLTLFVLTLKLEIEGTPFIMTSIIFDYNYLYTSYLISEIVGIGIVKGAQVAVFGMHFIDLNNDTLKILHTQFSYNKKIERGKKTKTVTDIQRVLKIWKMRKEKSLFLKL